MPTFSIEGRGGFPRHAQPKYAGVNACAICRRRAATVAGTLGVCADCIRARLDQTLPHIVSAHALARSAFGLPSKPVRAAHGLACHLCSHTCRVPRTGVGYCGLSVRRRTTAKASWYYDPLPANCVADFVCVAVLAPATTNSTTAPARKRGWNNLAVFYDACTFDWPVLPELDLPARDARHS